MINWNKGINFQSFFCLIIIIIEKITNNAPIKWKGVKNSPKNSVAKIAVTIGVGDKTIVAFETVKYDKVLYQQNNPKPYTVPIIIKKNWLYGLKKTLKSTGENVK